jgi:hypothetical protein
MGNTCTEILQRNATGNNRPFITDQKLQLFNVVVKFVPNVFSIFIVSLLIKMYNIGVILPSVLLSKHLSLCSVNYHLYFIVVTVIRNVLSLWDWILFDYAGKMLQKNWPLPSNVLHYSSHNLVFWIRREMKYIWGSRWTTGY